jgi:hypothetical protein
MFAVIALLVFVLALFGVHPGGLDLVIVGLAFLAAHLAFGSPFGPTWPRRP